MPFPEYPRLTVENASAFDVRISIPLVNRSGDVMICERLFIAGASLPTATHHAIGSVEELQGFIDPLTAGLDWFQEG